MRLSQEPRTRDEITINDWSKRWGKSAGSSSRPDAGLGIVRKYTNLLRKRQHQVRTPRGM